MADFQGFSQSGSCLSLLSLCSLLPLSLLMVWSKWKDLKFKLPRSSCFPFRALFGRLSPALAPPSPSILFILQALPLESCFYVTSASYSLNTPHTHLFFRSQTQCGGFPNSPVVRIPCSQGMDSISGQWTRILHRTGTVQNTQINKPTPRFLSH